MYNSFKSKCDFGKNVQTNKIYFTQLNYTINIYLIEITWFGFFSVSAESYFKDAEGVYLRHYGPHHDKTIGIQDQMARLQIRADRQEVKWHERWNIYF